MVENENLTLNQSNICNATVKEEFIRSTISSQKTKVPEITISSFSHTMITISIEQEIQNNTPAQKQTASFIEAAEKN
ncbi:7298_t:CDS:2 [Dentiscutata erythropus]|uniref:7298_t:CDS:1 n=1 Tax=Dentiscutata erythropus TaxID=1348616 RepID=A0A9N9HBJ4_9GLOM|nr:7298_t:CDS:2 [Dentiscutata erythropus]